MSKANVKLQLSFDLDIAVPERLLELDHESLCKTFSEVLGSMVFQGLPTVAGKQLAKAGGSIVAHHYHLSAGILGAPTLERDLLVAAAPHLTDEELEQLARRTQGKLPESPEELQRHLRRQALKLVNDYRMVPCFVAARLTSGSDAKLEGKLNLTNGSVLIGERDRQSRLQANQGPIVVEPLGTEVQLEAACAGHTLSGPVIEVSVAQIAIHRDPLIRVWQQQG
ncbi:hypothetical protein E6C76_18875 [Pseudothauera nasutitermitis]|uniref:Uncharacterized protein n=1 Tax=Pseudothauera nasutitermitis TaxID=2565930 RepID=A0A4S4ARC8_9RHOO|nr:hypothetical protein [Pseudothauera nasutitermitis]THF62381.1 hypothetical protein E6C76_18875 [Pseudothauera nasutitermitis]